MSTIQPILVPCTGTLADLHVTVDPSAPDRLHVYWGTALLQVIPRDKNSLLFRIGAGLLLNLKFRIGSVAKAFGISEKPLRIWRDALKKGDWSSLGGDLDRLQTKGKLRSDVKRYIRASYRQACEENGGRMPYGFRKQLCEQVPAIWPDQEVCEETLRQLFRDEDAAARPVKEATADDEQQQQQPTIDVGKAVDLTKNLSHSSSGTAEIARLSCHHDIDHNRKSSPDSIGSFSSNHEKKREFACDSFLPIREDSDSPDRGTEENHGPIVGVEPVENPQLMDRDKIVNPALTTSGKSSISDDHNRQLYSGFIGDLSSDEKKRQTTCDGSNQLPSKQNLPKCGSALATVHQTVGPPNRLCFPLLSGGQSDCPFISLHAGLLLLAPEFEQAFGQLPAILRQTGAQILTGCVNQEQGKLIDYNDLGQIVGKVIRDLDRQRTLLDLLAEQGAEHLVYEGNARLLKLRSADELVLYDDTHHSKYTGCEQFLLGWSGQQKKVLRGIMMEFFHTAAGEPCMIGHYDNFYDGRQRFFLLRERLVERLSPWAGHFVWIHDRGYWSYEFLRQIVECGDIFIQWEKNYKQDGWQKPYQQDGHFTITLQGNNSRDRRKQVKVDWREQKWDRFTNGRRFIIRVKHASGQSGEVAIVTSHQKMPAKEVIRLMLSRFLQENDFSYLNRHVGINELTARKFDRYEAIAHQLQDRDQDSRVYRKTKKHKLALQEKLKQCLFKLDSLPAVSFAILEKQRKQLRQEGDRLAEQLNRLKPAEASDTVIARLSRKVRELKEKFHLNSDQRVVAEERQAEEAKRGKLHLQINEVKDQLAQVTQTESRLLMLIEERYVRPNMDRKALVDAVRITARNTFCQALKEFRPLYDNYRDDHVVLRALTYAAGVIVPYPDRIDIYLLPRLDRQPEQWDRITSFFRDREKCIEQRFATPVRFILARTDAQIFRAVNRAHKRGDRLSD